MLYKDSNIRKFGRWTSVIWQMYIHRQIAKISEGVTQNTSTTILDQNISVIDPNQQ